MTCPLQKKTPAFPPGPVDFQPQAQLVRVAFVPIALLGKCFECVLGWW